MNLMASFREWRAVQSCKDEPPLTWPRVFFIIIAAHLFWILVAANLDFFAQWAGLEKWIH